MHNFSSHASEVLRYCKQFHAFFYADWWSEYKEIQWTMNKNAKKTKTVHAQRNQQKNEIQEGTHTHILIRSDTQGKTKMRKTVWMSENILIGFLFQTKYANTLYNTTTTTLTLAPLIWNNVEVKSNMRFSQRKRTKNNSNTKLVCTHRCTTTHETMRWMCMHKRHRKFDQNSQFRNHRLQSLGVQRYDCIWCTRLQQPTNECLSHFYLSPLNWRFQVEHFVLVLFARILFGSELYLPVIEQKWLANWNFFAISHTINWIYFD